MIWRGTWPIPAERKGSGTAGPPLINLPLDPSSPCISYLRIPALVPPGIILQRFKDACQTPFEAQFFRSLPSFPQSSSIEHNLQYWPPILPTSYGLTASAYIPDTGQGPAKEAVTAKFTLLLNSYQASVQTDTAEVNSSRPVSQGVGRLSIESPHSSLGLVLSEDVPKLKETHQEGPAHLDDVRLGLVFLLHGLHRGQ